MVSRRSTLINLLITELKKINGQWDDRPTSLVGPYLFKSNVFDNVYDRWKFHSDINDYPTILFTIGQELITHISSNVRYGSFLVQIRGYVKDEDSLSAADDLLEDIEFVIENIREASGFIDNQFVDARIVNLSTDNGLLQKQYGIGITDMTVDFSYQKV